MNTVDNSVLFMGMPITNIQPKTESIKDDVLKLVSVRKLDLYACDYFRKDDDYINYRNGIIPDQFWIDAKDHFWREFSSKGENLPSYFRTYMVWDGIGYTTWIGIEICKTDRVTNYPSVVCVDTDKIQHALQVILSDYPEGDPKLMLGILRLN